MVFLAAATGFWLWAFLDAIRRPRWAYVSAGRNKTGWVVLAFFLGFWGALLYVIVARSKVRQIQTEAIERADHPSDHIPEADFVTRRFERYHTPGFVDVIEEILREWRGKGWDVTWNRTDINFLRSQINWQIRARPRDIDVLLWQIQDRVGV